MAHKVVMEAMFQASRAKLCLVSAIILFSLSSASAGISKREVVIAGKVKNFTDKYVEVVTANNLIKVPRHFFYKAFKPKWGKKVVVTIPSYYTLSLKNQVKKKKRVRQK